MNLVLTIIFYMSYIQIGVPGHAGEYIVQEGFGWTNGVILYLLSEYGDIIDSKDQTIYQYYKSIEIENFRRILLLLLILVSIAFMINILKKKRFHIFLIPAVALTNMFKYYRLQNKTYRRFEKYTLRSFIKLT